MDMKKLNKLVLAAVLAAFTCVATMVIRIPSPMDGYVNLGDCIVLISGWVLGPVYGFCSAGIGSMMADIISGYPHYAPATLVIKGAVAICAALIPLVFRNRDKIGGFIARLVSGAAGEAVMVLAYFGYEALLLGNGLAAASGIPGNIVQGVVGIITGMLIYEILNRLKVFEKLSQDQ